MYKVLFKFFLSNEQQKHKTIEAVDRNVEYAFESRLNYTTWKIVFKLWALADGNHFLRRGRSRVGIASGKRVQTIHSNLIGY